MAASPGKSTKDLHDAAQRGEQGSGSSNARGTRVLIPIRSGKEAADALIQNWEEVCREQSVAYSSLSPDLEMLASDRKSERLVNLWVGEILGEDGSIPSEPASAPAPHTVPMATIAAKSRSFRLSAGTRVAGCLLGITAILAIAFVAVPSPKGLQSMMSGSAGPQPAPSPKLVPSVSAAIPVTVLAPRTQFPWLDTEMELFNRTNTQGFYVERITDVGEGNNVRAVLGGFTQPTVFAPDQAGGVEKLNEGWLRERHGNLVADIDDPQAFRRVSHLPLVVLDAPWVTARQRAGGIAFLEFLAKERAGK